MCSSWSSTRNIVESTHNSIHCHWEEICSWIRRPENILKKKKDHKFLQWPITLFLKDKRSTEGTYNFSYILQTLQIRIFKNLKKHWQTFKRTATWVRSKEEYHQHQTIVSWFLIQHSNSTRKSWCKIQPQWPPVTI